MRNLHLLNRYRDASPEVVRHFGSIGDSTCGMFNVPSPIDGGALKVLASSDAGWDHVSVSRRNRCPNWPEMSHIKSLFFKDDETAMQLHVPSPDHVNDHPYCLHLWRPIGMNIPRPPGWMVGGVSSAEAEREYRKATA
jgi:hypothetical protein